MIDHSKFLVKQYKYWGVYVHENQSYLGRCVVWCDRTDALDLTDATEEERDEFFLILSDLKRVSIKSFGSEWFNYAFLGNETRHLHGHFIPRYSTDKRFAGLEFKDERWGHNYRTNHTFVTTPEALEEIRLKLKASFPEENESVNELSQELLRMFDEDQAMRLSGSWDIEIDRRNTARMKEIVATYGWPSTSKFGESAARAAWLLVQHADADSQFQEEVLALMKELPDGEASKQNIALLEDRVRVNTGRPTLYGTQFYNDSDGVFGPQPIEDPETLDERRAAVGLEPFEKYEKDMRRLNNERQEQKRVSGEDK